MLVARQRTARTENVAGGPNLQTSGLSKIDAAIARNFHECDQTERAVAKGLGERFGTWFHQDEATRQWPHGDSSVRSTGQLAGSQLAVRHRSLGNKTGTASADIDRRRLASRIARAGGDAANPLDSRDVRQTGGAIAARVRVARSFWARGQRVLEGFGLTHARGRHVSRADRWSRRIEVGLVRQDRRQCVPFANSRRL